MDIRTRDGVVAGVDGSGAALGAVRWAAAEAARRREPLRLVSAFGWTDDFDVRYPGLGGDYRDSLLEQARRWLAKAVAVARQQHPGLEISDEVRIGSPIEVLADEARRARLLVVGNHGAHRIEEVLLGSVGMAMAAHADCPVAVVRGPERIGSALPVVVGVDGSPLSEPAIAFAYQAAADRAVPLVVLHVWSDAFLDPMTAAQLLGPEAQARERERLAERLAGWSEKYPQVVVEVEVTRDRPAHALLERSRRAQLVVVGSRGHGKLVGLVLGSVSNALVHGAGCPVVVARDHPTPKSRRQ